MKSPVPYKWTNPLLIVDGDTPPFRKPESGDEPGTFRVSVVISSAHGDSTSGWSKMILWFHRWLLHISHISHWNQLTLITGWVEEWFLWLKHCGFFDFWSILKEGHGCDRNIQQRVWPPARERYCNQFGAQDGQLWTNNDGWPTMQMSNVPRSQRPTEALIMA